MMKFEGKTAVVTGGSRGIGRAIARRLAAEGWSVGIDYLQARDQALALEEELRGQGYQALAVQADVADREAVEAMVRDASQALGPVELLVNNAGVACKMFEALYSAGVNINMISTSEIKVSVLVDEWEADRAVQAIHNRFFSEFGNA